MKKDLLLIAAVILLAAVLIHGVKIESVEEYYLGHSEDISEGDDTVFVSIDCSRAVGDPRLSPAVSALLPADGKILPETEMRLFRGDTAYGLLSRASRYHGILMVTDGSGAAVYIKSISQLAEFAVGDLSGWMFRVNGEFPAENSASYRLSPGDRLEWVYSTNLGQDFGK